MIAAMLASPPDWPAWSIALSMMRRMFSSGTACPTVSRTPSVARSPSRPRTEISTSTPGKMESTP